MTNEQAAQVIAANVRRLRQEAGWTLEALGERSGQTKYTLSRLESGRHLPSLATLLRVADGLGVAPGELLAAARKRSR